MKFTYFLLTILLTINATRVFGMSEFEKFQEKCAMPVSLMLVGATMFGMSLYPLPKIISDFRNPDAKGPFAFKTKTGNLVVMGLGSSIMLCLTIYSMFCLLTVHNEYKDKINGTK